MTILGELPCGANDQEILSIVLQLWPLHAACTHAELGSPDLDIDVPLNFPLEETEKLSTLLNPANTAAGENRKDRLPGAFDATVQGTLSRARRAGKRQSSGNDDKARER
jgi:hypothetical protein